ncbi:hypothetical protein BOO86_08605 [Mycobacterium sp. CBMA 234]|nr:hypothetical protein [Mycolicibacterium sp. CBMA 234]
MTLGFRGIGYGLRRNPECANHILIDDDVPVTGQRTHGVFLVAGHAQFADDERIQRRAESGRDFGSDRDPAAGQAEHHDVASAAVCRQQISQDAPRFRAVTKDAPRYLVSRRHAVYLVHVGLVPDPIPIAPDQW